MYLVCVLVLHNGAGFVGFGFWVMFGFDFMVACALYVLVVL